MLAWFNYNLWQICWIFLKKNRVAACCCNWFLFEPKVTNNDRVAWIGDIRPFELQMPIIRPWPSNIEALGNGIWDTESATTTWCVRPAISNMERMNTMNIIPESDMYFIALYRCIITYMQRYAFYPAKQYRNATLIPVKFQKINFVSP